MTSFHPYDYHTHTDFSEDSSTNPHDMIKKAISLGVKEYAITDHYDPDYPEMLFEIDSPAYHKALLELEKEYESQIKIIKGIEIGIQHGSTSLKCEEEALSFPYDFIIGSFHCFHGEDLYIIDFEKYDVSKIVPSFYEYCLNCLDEFMNFDVLGHINVIDRYLGSSDYFKQEGVPYFMSDNFKKTYSKSMEIIEAILDKLIKKNKGIEINTSHIRYNLSPRTVPSKDILKLYKELGGEIITIGSDAHRQNQIQEGFKDTIEYAKSFGYTYHCTYHNRIPSFVKIK